MNDPIVITGYARTPQGALQGSLSSLSAPALGSVAVRASVERSGLAAGTVDQIIMGCVLPAGLGQAPARQAALGAGLAQSTQATTVNKMCGSGMQAAIIAHDILVAGSAEIIVAGGMESMSNAPYLLSRHRAGKRMGHDTLIDSMFFDGLEDAYEPGKLMGACAEDTAREYGLSRADQDAYGLRSLERANAAIAGGAFEREMAAVEVPTRDGPIIVSADEQPGNPDRIPQLKPAFARDGTVTAANSASISDGAAALVLMRASTAQSRGLPVVARIVAHAAHAQEPQRFTTAPVAAIQKVLDRAGWSVGDVDLFEVNEAFAVVAMIAAQELGIADHRLNVNGGACALGHPIGASGARIVATLLGALENRGLQRGVASLCLGGGEAVALAIEIVQGELVQGDRP
jgi:acetyl-CoA C-acetyltransferase